MVMLKRGVCIRTQSATVVVLLDQRKIGWNCLCVFSLDGAYKYQDIFVFDDDLKNGEEVIGYEGGARA